MDILKRDIRETIVSGLFYPEDPEELTQTIKGLIESNQTEDENTSAQIILSPHGTWEQCGECIASAFASAADYKPDRILLLGPVHREKKVQKLYLPSKKYFNSPLGLINVEQKICKNLSLNDELFIISDSPHMEEHALELQLPFIQTLFPETPIIPILSGNLKRSSIKKAAAEIKAKILSLPGNTLIILSANLSRYTLLPEAENEAEALLNHITMPLESSLLELKKNAEISSCGTVVLTLLSDLGIFNKGKKGQFKVLERKHTEVLDKNGTMAVYYAGGRWL
jgi:MEMO1 family protein